MSMIYKQDQDNLLALADNITNPTEGQLVIGDPVICKTCAYYIGSWCLEWMGNENLAGPVIVIAVGIRQHFVWIDGN